MGQSIVYAIGGTGAKLLEALVFLCAAGCTRENLEIRLIDQDQNNGNMERTLDLLRSYAAIRASLRPRPSSMFLSQIRFMESIVRVIPDIHAKLYEAYDVHALPSASADEEGLLMQVLFSGEELTDDMVNGFKGRPAVGAAAFLSPASFKSSVLWSTVREDITRARANAVDRILLLGSAFGGTGAAGVPTLAGYLRRALTGQSARIGAALMLRYYDVADRERFGPVPMIAVRAALEYYAEVLGAGKGRLLDALYLVGLHPELSIPRDSEGGGRRQRNPALLSELVGALGAIHFLEHGDCEWIAEQKQWVDRQPSSPIWIAYRAELEKVDWSDLPNVIRRDGDGMPGPPNDNACRLLCSFARFALAYPYSVQPALRLSAVPDLDKIPIYARFLDSNRVQRQDYDSIATLLRLFCEAFLRWFWALHRVELQTTNLENDADEKAFAVGLAKLDELGRLGVGLDGAPEVLLTVLPTELNTSTAEQRRLLKAAFASLELRPGAPKLAAVIRRLAVLPRRQNQRGEFGHLIEALYRCAAAPAQV